MEMIRASRRTIGSSLTSFPCPVYQPGPKSTAMVTLTSSTAPALKKRAKDSAKTAQTATQTALSGRLPG